MDDWWDVREERLSAQKISTSYQFVKTADVANLASGGDQQHSVRTFQKAARLVLNWMKDEVESGRYDEREEMILKQLAA